MNGLWIISGAVFGAVILSSQALLLANCRRTAAQRDPQAKACRRAPVAGPLREIPSTFSVRKANSPFLIAQELAGLNQLWPRRA